MGLVIVLILIAAVSIATCESEGEKCRSSLMDWQCYVKQFNKQYSSLSQQLARQKIFMVKLMNVFLTRMKFGIRKLSYYTTINQYSDLTQAESRRLLSGDGGGIDDPSDKPMSDSEAHQHLMEAYENDGLNINDIQNEIKEERSKLMEEKPQSHSRLTKRDVLTMTSCPRLDLTLDSIKPQPKLQLKWMVPPQNVNYEPFEVQSSASLQKEENFVHDLPKEEVEEIAKESNFESISKMVSFQGLGTIKDSFMNWWCPETRVSDNSEEQPVEETKPEPTMVREKNQDILLYDWRQSGCIGIPMDQGFCNSCYAVSSTSYVEWAFCMNQDNVLTPLSPQYMVSCGPQFRLETEGKMQFHGCNMGFSKQTMEFIKQYGVELEANMPYLALDTSCPIEEYAPQKVKGYIRPNIKKVIRLGPQTKQLDVALKRGPLIVSLRELEDFHAYGGGIIQDCHDFGGHATLLVGSGIENGVEYLLIKNSFGTDWGLEGYFKLARSATTKCVKEYISPVISFPGKKAQARRIKAYLASLEESDPKQDELGLLEIENGKLLAR